MNQNIDQYKKTENVSQNQEAIDTEIDKIQNENINNICQLIEAINEVEKMANDLPQDNKKKIQTSIINIKSTVSGFNIVDSINMIASDKDKGTTTDNKDNQIIYTDEDAYKKAKEEYDSVYKQYSTDIELYNKYNKEAWNSYLSFFVRDGFFYDNGFTP
jgi:hypothetical protein